jgi:flagellar motor switch protein FliN/FliY
MAINRIAEKPLPTFSNSFFNALAAALTEASGSLWQMAVEADDDLNQGGSEETWVKLTLGGGIGGEAFVKCDATAEAMLESKFCEQRGEAPGTEPSEGLRSLIEASLSEFRDALKDEYGLVTIVAGLTSEPAADPANLERATLADTEGNRATILMYPDSTLAEALRLHADDQDKAVAGSPGRVDGGAPAAEPVNLNLVMDVELNVTLRFGQRQLTLREVLELTTGSVIELDRQVEEPVELLLEGKVIARGEAVVIDGNYGLRVIEVLQPVFYPAIR